MGVLWSLDLKGVRGTAGGRSPAGRPGKGGGQRDMESSWGIQATFTSDEEICIPGAGERQIVQPLWKTEWRFLEKLDLERPCDPTIPLPDINPEELKAGS